MKINTYSKASFTGTAYVEHVRFWEDVIASSNEPFRFTEGSVSLPTGGTRWRRLEKVFSAPTREVVYKIAGSDPANTFVVVTSAITFLLSGYTATRTVLLKTPLVNAADDKKVYADNVLFSFSIMPEESIRELVLRCQKKLA